MNVLHRAPLAPQPTSSGEYRRPPNDGPINQIINNEHYTERAELSATTNT